MLTYKSKWEEIKETTLPGTASTYISVIIPARNEAANISNILKDILQQDYPLDLYEVIVIDDHSEDETFRVVSQFKEQYSNISVYKLSEISATTIGNSSYKKQAIESAVNLAKGKLILTTDADCRAEKTWLRTIAAFYEKENCKLIAGPVCFQHDNTTFEKFQALDFCGMQAITAASLQLKIFNMANGANLAYEKEAFLKVQGYRNIDDKASGDDMLLVYKIAQQFPESIRFLKNKQAIVYTRPMHSIREFLQQRFRWTSKSTSYQDKRITLILGLVYLFVLSIWVNVAYFLAKLGCSLFCTSAVCSMEFNSRLFIISLILLLQLIAKSITDYYFLRSASSFFNRSDLVKTFFTSELWHIWYIPFVGTFGNILQYNWKGRKLK